MNKAFIISLAVVALPFVAAECHQYITIQSRQTRNSWFIVYVTGSLNSTEVESLKSHGFDCSSGTCDKYKMESGDQQHGIVNMEDVNTALNVLGHHDLVNTMSHEKHIIYTLRRVN
jgi:hypothetical protein